MSPNPASSWLILALVTLVFPGALSGQARVVIGGWVVETDGRTGIANASVELTGHGRVLTTQEGAFRFDNVAQGAYRLRIDAFGFAPSDRVLVVDKDLVMTVTLDVTPFLLDSILVEARAIEFKGRVRDDAKDIPLVDADIFSDGADPTHSGLHGHFDLDVFEGVPLSLSVRAFGYLPVDTVIVPQEDEEHVFHLVADPVVERLIQNQLARIVERSASRLALFMRPMDSDALRRWGNLPLKEMLRLQYPFTHTRVSCMILNEETLTRPVMEAMLETTLAREVERLEFLFDGAMLRVYTRPFILKMLATGKALRRPVFVSIVVPPVCL